MTNYLNPNIRKLQSKGVDSVRARVVNLHEINKEITIQDIIRETGREFYNHFSEGSQIIQQDLDTAFLNGTPTAL